MEKNLYIDASHPNETRVVLKSGDNIEDYEYEGLKNNLIKNNIYLGKVSRVEPSLQAAFIDFGRDRHGFLSFNDIQSDYYQIPQSDLIKIKEEEERDREELLKQSEKEEQNKECCVCMDEDQTHVIVPCMHKALCEGCAEDFQKFPAPTCPICRADILKDPTKPGRWLIREVFE